MPGMVDGRVAAIIAVTVVSAVVCWTVVKIWANWLSRPRPALESKEQEQRLQRIEQAVEAIAIEVERIGEGQRFVTKLFGDRAQMERLSVRPPATYRPVDTPS